jgi:hypothetical protein
VIGLGIKVLHKSLDITNDDAIGDAVKGER